MVKPSWRLRRLASRTPFTNCRRLQESKKEKGGELCMLDSVSISGEALGVQVSLWQAKITAFNSCFAHKPDYSHRFRRSFACVSIPQMSVTPEYFM